MSQSSKSWRDTPACLPSSGLSLGALLTGRTLLPTPASCAGAHTSGSSLQFPRVTGGSPLHILADAFFSFITLGVNVHMHSYLLLVVTL